MRGFLLTALILTGFACDAALPHRPFRRTPQNMEHVYNISWKQITAGGGAAGAVVAAYKVSDGIQEGLKISAEKKPECFMSLFRDLTLPVRFALWLFCFTGLAWITLKIYRKYNNRNRKGETER